MNPEPPSEFVRYPQAYHRTLVPLADSVTYTVKSPALAIDIRVLRDKPQPVMTVFQEKRDGGGGVCVAD